MLVLTGGETTGQRASRLGGCMWSATPEWVRLELGRARRRPSYRRGLAIEMLRDFERANGLQEDRSERMIHAAGVLLQATQPFVAGFNGLTLPKIIQSRTCQFYVRCDLEPTQNELLGNLNPAPNLVIRGNLTQRFGMRVEVDSVGDGSLGSTTLKISFDNGATFPISSANGNAFVTTATITQLSYGGFDTGIWLSCAPGPYDAGDVWVSRIGSLADQAGTASGRDFVALGNDVGIMFDYVASSSAIRNRPFMSSDAARFTYFSTAYIPPDPGTTPSFVSWVGNARAFVNTGRIWGTGTVNQFCVRQANPTPDCALAGAAAVLSNSQMLIGTWFGCEAFCADSTTDRLKIGGNASLGPAPAGGCASGVPNSGFTLGARATTGALPSSVDFAECGLWTGGEPTGNDLPRSRAYKTVIFGVAA
jgi:hypothetical protein